MCGGGAGGQGGRGADWISFHSKGFPSIISDFLLELGISFYSNYGFPSMLRICQICNEGDHRIHEILT